MGIAIAKTFFDHDTVYQCMVAPKLFPPGRPFVEGIDNVGLLRSPNIRMFFFRGEDGASCRSNAIE